MIDGNIEVGVKGEGKRMMLHMSDIIATLRILMWLFLNPDTESIVFVLQSTMFVLAFGRVWAFERTGAHFT